MSSAEIEKYKENAPLAFGLCVGAGLCTCIGALVVYNKRLVKAATKQILAAGLGLSAGVMLYVSFCEILVKSKMAFEGAKYSHEEAVGYSTLCFFGGVMIMKIIDFIYHTVVKSPVSTECCGTSSVDEEQKDRCGPSEGQEAGEANRQSLDAGDVELRDKKETAVVTPSVDMDLSGLEHINQLKLRKMGALTAFAVAIHNFPEGLATFMATIESLEVGIPLAFGIAIHNIPEGIAVAMPIYYATGNRHKAFLWAFLSGISEPIGAAIGWAILATSLDGVAFGILFGLVAGMMVSIACHELIPTIQAPTLIWTAT